jgi:hypothetical protein
LQDRVWDIKTDSHCNVVARKGWIFGVEPKEPDAEPDFGYNDNAKHEVTGAVEVPETEAAARTLLDQVHGAWSVIHLELICVQTSAQTIEDVKAQKSGLPVRGA